jgi:hypothetical protein
MYRPDVIAGVDHYLPGPDGSLYSNPAAFAIPQPGKYGNLAPNAPTGPGFASLDMNLSKKFMFTERLNLELRADLYNVLNHPNFSNPASNLGAGIPSSPSSSGLQPGQALTGSAGGTGFGLFTSTVLNYIGLGTARQLQLSLRLSF